MESLREQLSERNEDIERLKGDLAELEEFEAVREELAADPRSILRLLGEADPENEEARERIDELQAEKRELREQVEDLEERADDLQQRTERAEAGSLEISDDYTHFLDVEVVRFQIQKAKDETSASKRYVQGRGSRASRCS